MESATRKDKDRGFNAGLQWRMLGRTGWAVIWRSERGPAPRGALSRTHPVIGEGLKGESWGWCPVVRHECACASRGARDRQEQEGKRLPAHPLAAQTQGRGAS